MNKELALKLTKQADEIFAKAKEAERAMLNASDEEYDAYHAEYRKLSKQSLELRKQALEATR